MVLRTFVSARCRRRKHAVYRHKHGGKNPSRENSANQTAFVVGPRRRARVNKSVQTTTGNANLSRTLHLAPSLTAPPPRSPSVKPRGSSHPRSFLCAHLLCWTAKLADEARGRSGVRRSGYLAVERRGGGGFNGGRWDASEQCPGFHGDTVLQCLQPSNSLSNPSALRPPPSVSLLF